MGKTKNSITKNFENNFKGITNFVSGQSRRHRRRLEGYDIKRRFPTMIRSISLPQVNNVEKGVHKKVSTSGIYRGTKLKPDSTTPSTIDTKIQASMYYKYYKLGSENNNDNRAGILKPTQ